MRADASILASGGDVSEAEVRDAVGFSLSGVLYRVSGREFDAIDDG